MSILSKSILEYIIIIPFLLFDSRIDSCMSACDGDSSLTPRPGRLTIRQGRVSEERQAAKGTQRDLGLTAVWAWRRASYEPDEASKRLERPRFDD